MQDTFAETLPPSGLELHHPASADSAESGHGHDRSGPEVIAGEDGPPKVKRGKLLLYGLGGLTVALLLGGYGILERGKSEEQLAQLTAEEAIPTVDLIKPLVGVTGQEVVLPRTIDAYFQAPIYARVSGYLKMWYTDFGAKVKTGELLALIDTPDLDQELLHAKADLGVAVANYKLAELTATRWQKLLKSDAVAVQDVDVKTGDSAARQAAVTAAQANVDRLQALEAFKRIVAPFDGVITARKTDVGALINAGSGIGPELFTAADVHEMRVYVRVPQSESADITNGMTAFLSLPQYPGKKFPATVATTASAIDPVSNTLLVELSANNKDGVLTPGTFAEVHFELPAQPDAVRIPTSALLFRQGGLKVAVLGDDGKVQIKPISPGRDLGNQMEVLSGLGPNDRVINSPPDSLLAGQTVRILDAAGKPEVAAR